jgi:hypothetical protein
MYVTMEGGVEVEREWKGSRRGAGREQAGEGNRKGRGTGMRGTDPR